MRFLTVFATMQFKLNERIKTDQVRGYPVKTSLIFAVIEGYSSLRRLCKVVNIKRRDAVERNRVFRDDYSIGNTLHDIAT